MIAAIITIGSELVNGMRVDTNSSFISRKLTEQAIDTKLAVSVPDCSDSIKKSLDFVFNSNFDFLFITGGLGPTHDDITRDIISTYFNEELFFNKNVYKKIDSRYPSKNICESQALILNNSEPIINSTGTATGIYYIYNNCKVFVMPGVPSEIESMLDNEIIPKYIPNKQKKEFRIIRTIGASESIISDRLKKLIKRYSGILEFAFLPSVGSVDLRISSKVSNCSFIDQVADECYEILSPNSFIIGTDSIVDVVATYLNKNGLSISVAESCTGGLISKMLTDIPGSSAYFSGSVICYSNKSKIEELGVRNSLINDNGAVSEEVAESMANSIREKFGTDIGLSITGISGPSGGSKEKPVGLTYVAISANRFNKKFKYIVSGDRNMHRCSVALRALNDLRVTFESF